MAQVSVLQAIVTTARREELVETNPAERAERPKLPPFRPQILKPAEVARVCKAFTDDQARTAFLTLVLTGIRRSELQALKWGDVSLIENVLRIRDSKSEDGRRTIAFGKTLADALWDRQRATKFQHDEDRVFCHPERGTVSGGNVRGGAHGRSQGRRRGKTTASVPRPQTHCDHGRRRRRFAADRGDGEGRAREHEHDAAVLAPCRRRVP